MSNQIPDRAHIDHCDEVLVHMAAGTYSWCQLVTFSIRTASADDSQLISAVISHRRYRDHCAGPFGEQAYHDLHGPYRIETITVPAFQRCSIAQAVEILYAWPGYELMPHCAHTWQQSQEIIGAWVTPVLQSATTIYRLVLPREGHEHDWGWVVGCVVSMSSSQSIAIIQRSR